jgi:DNA-binding phage protein
MALTRDFKATVKARVQRDPKFRRALLREAIESMIAGDVDTGKAVLRDYINATIGFSQLAASVDIPSKSLMRMLAPAGNPTASNFFEIVAILQRREGVRLRVTSVAA